MVRTADTQKGFAGLAEGRTMAESLGDGHNPA